MKGNGSGSKGPHESGSRPGRDFVIHSNHPGLERFPNDRVGFGRVELA